LRKENRNDLPLYLLVPNFHPHGNSHSLDHRSVYPASRISSFFFDSLLLQSLPGPPFVIAVAQRALFLLFVANARLLRAAPCTANFSTGSIVPLFSGSPLDISPVPDRRNFILLPLQKVSLPNLCANGPPVDGDRENPTPPHPLDKEFKRFPGFQKKKKGPACVAVASLSKDPFCAIRRPFLSQGHRRQHFPPPLPTTFRLSGISKYTSYFPPRRSSRLAPIPAPPPRISIGLSRWTLRSEFLYRFAWTTTTGPHPLSPSVPKSFTSCSDLTLP